MNYFKKDRKTPENKAIRIKKLLADIQNKINTFDDVAIDLEIEKDYLPKEKYLAQKQYLNGKIIHLLKRQILLNSL